MSKTVAGLMVCFGLLGALVGIGGASTISGMSGSPDTDWMLQLGQIGFGLLAVVCMVVFFVGAVRFSRGK